MKSLKFVSLLLLISSCAPIFVNLDYDDKVDFSTYKTYNYVEDMNTGLSELDTKRLLNALDDVMTTKGLTFSETSDFLINIQSDEFQNNQQNNVGVGVGGTGRNVGGGLSVGIPIGQNKINRRIIFSFIDDEKDGVFWEVVSESSYNPKATPEQREEKIKAIISKVLSKYPPKK